MIDSFQHIGQRRKLVEGLRKKGITDEAVLKAINEVPRHWFFINTGIDHMAYVDQAFPILAGQTISQPFTVAFQTQLLEIKRREKVLEIGTGSGYQAAILYQMGAKVFSIERQKELYDQTSKLLPRLGYNVHCFLGDGYRGQKNYGLYDKIIITAAAPFIPDALKEQLRVGGYLVVPLGEGKSQKMLRLIKKSEEEFEAEEYGNFAFVPMLKGIVK